MTRRGLVGATLGWSAALRLNFVATMLPLMLSFRYQRVEREQHPQSLGDESRHYIR